MKQMIRAAALILALASASVVALPDAALAAPRTTTASPIDYASGNGLPIYRVTSTTFVPKGFTVDAAQAIAASEANAQMDAIHAREHPLQFLPHLWLGNSWLVDFTYHGKLVAEVSVGKTGHVTGVWTGALATAIYARGDYATEFGHWWVLIPFALLFLLPFLDPRRWKRIIHLDALVILSFLISYLLFDHAKLVPAVWLVYPPLLYLLGRMLWIGFGRGAGPPAAGGRASRGLAPLLSIRALAIGLGLLVVARIVLSLADRTVIDVGYASVVGAHAIATGHSIYAASAVGHGDTYGPIAYLAYLPFELIWPWHGAWNYLPAAHAASITFDLVTILGLVLLGRRLRPGQEGLRLGLALGWAWAACPMTLLDLMMHSNDGLIAMLSVLSLLAFVSPAGRGALLGLATAAKFAPAALIGLYAGQRKDGRRGFITCVVSFAAVVVISIGLYLPSGGIHAFYEQTIGFQLTRSDVFSPWGLHPALDPFKTLVEIAALLLCALVVFRPSERTLVHSCALAGALTIAVQLPAVHWFYYYLVWFVPFVLVAVLVPHGEVETSLGDHLNEAAMADALAAGRPSATPVGV